MAHSFGYFENTQITQNYFYELAVMTADQVSAGSEDLWSCLSQR